MDQLAKQISKKFAKNKALQQYLAKEPIARILVLAFPEFFAQDPAYLEQKFNLVQIITWQLETLEFAVVRGYFAQGLSQVDEQFKTSLEFQGKLMGNVLIKELFSRSMLPQIREKMVPIKKQSIEFIKTAPQTVVLGTFAKAASPWATQQYANNSLTFWKVLNREPRLLAYNW